MGVAGSEADPGWLEMRAVPRLHGERVSGVGVTHLRYPVHTS